MKKHGKLKRIILFFVIISLNFNIFCFQAFAQNKTSTETNDIIRYNGSVDELPKYIYESYIENPKAESLDIYDENLYSVTTNNIDGTQTVEIFQTPIKYVENNEIKFIDTTIKECSVLDKVTTDKYYECVNSSVKSYFPNKLSDGVSIQKEGYSIKFYPITDKTLDFENLFTKPTLSEDNILTYEDVFDDFNEVTYTPVSTGVKEEIILEEYTGKNVFEFTLEFENLEPLYLKGDSIPLIDKQTKEQIASISQIDIKDSAQKFNTSLYNTIEMKKVDTDIYILRLIIDENFLESDSTVYPVIIDPTITFNADPIYDAPVFSGYPNTNFNSNTYNVVGYHGSSYGEGVAFIKINNLQNYKYINQANVTSAYLRVYEGSGKTSSATVNLFNCMEIWDNTTVTYNNMPTIHTAAYSSRTISSSGWYNFNITNLLRGWMRYTVQDGGKSQHHGVALKMSDTGVSSRHFASANNTSYPPSIIINYTIDTPLENDVYYIHSENSDLYLSVSGSNVVQSNYNQQRNQHWAVQHAGSGYYFLKSSSSDFTQNLASVSTNISNTTNIGVSAATNDTRLFRILQNTDGTYRILSKCGDYIHGVSVANSSTASGANVQLSTYTGENNQRWRFYPVNKQMQTDVNLLDVYAEKYAEQYPGKYAELHGDSHTNILVFQYIRSEQYNSDSWSEVAGEINAGFSGYIATEMPFLMEMRDNPQFCYGGISGCVELTHMSATINALMYNSTSLEAILATETNVDALAGWAGDFQSLVIDTLTATGNSNDYTVFYNKFKALMGTDTSCFSYEDLYSDLDAIYINDNYSSSGKIGTKIYDYYNDDIYLNRYTHFIAGRSKTEFYDDVYVFGQNKYLGIKQWPIYQNRGVTVTDTQAKAAAQAFTDFIFEQV